MNIRPCVFALLLAWVVCGGWTISVAAQPPLRLAGPPVREAIPLVLMHTLPPHVPGREGAVFTPWNSPEQLRALIAKGKVDVALMTVASAAALHNKGVHCTVVAVFSGPAWIVSTNQEFSSGDMLNGEEILLPFGPGEMPEVVLRILMKKHGLSFMPRHVGSALEAVGMLRSGRAKHAFLVEPAAGKAMSALGIQIDTSGIPVLGCLDIRALWAETFPQSPCMPLGALTVFGSLADSQEALTAIRTSYVEGVSHAREHPRMALETTGDVFPVLGRSLEGMNVERVCDIRIMDSDHAAMMATFFLTRLLEVSPASVGGRMPGEDFLRLSDARH